MGSDIGSGPARSMFITAQTKILLILFLYFNLNQKAMGRIHNNTYRLPHIEFSFLIQACLDFFICKNLHIEPFNITKIKVFILIFARPMWAAQKSKLVEVRILFYWFQCHYPLIAYLRGNYSRQETAHGNKVRGTPPLTRFSYSAVFYLTRFF